MNKRRGIYIKSFQVPMLSLLPTHAVHSHLKTKHAKLSEEVTATANGKKSSF